MHNETPIPDPTTNRTRGIQLWVALPASNLSAPATYRDIAASDMPVATPTPGVSIRIITGEAFGQKADQVTASPVWYLDVTLEPGTRATHLPIPASFNAFVHVLEGRPTVCGQESEAHGTLFLRRDGEGVDLRNESETTRARMLVIAGDPLEGQTVVQYGPFVSTSQSGIRKAMQDFQMVGF
jgi:redox-sensitive bicupin YhaK (pirin superfamily)